MRKIFTLMFCMVFISMQAQVTFVIDSQPSNTPAGDNIYIAGSFNGWNPGDTNYMLHKNANDKWEITLEGFSNGDVIEYKFTRGNWPSVEKGANGEEIANRTFSFGNGETVLVTVEMWADNPPEPSIVSDNVMVMADDFYMPQLNRYRRISLYLPPDYGTSNKNYPVLYMHDGQNLFDSSLAFAGEWKVDDTLDELADQGYQVPIVVGIDNSQYRAEEYLGFPGGDGDAYIDFIVETLKPFIDSNYRTLSDRDNTGIMGSSFGGVISLYGALKYQNVFSKAGLFSPAYWAKTDVLNNYLIQTGFQHDIRFYQNAGENEGQQYIGPMNDMDNNLNTQGFQNVSSKVISGGGHNEATWASDFEAAYLWLFNPVINSVRDDLKVRKLIISPNPVRNVLKINVGDRFDGGYAVITNIAGKGKSKTYEGVCNELDVSSLVPGVYVIRLEVNGSAFAGRFVKM
ncbi:alpha/beta hydrolase-fold protein [Marinilabilia rubra]|uniref:Phosphonate ABC transporter ATP-binding protein n=1 Tax=Marinilabilia rubra TaxID=2162893 RepID=A0A2U2B5E8_9BACT|nr:alpha/beta hydrolase-fold protein [Marinilabilia rubra]PWD98299.1 phosphonate ABC transporter ATP-binding protein [Marinilabilia rubra]